jgi:hypothetical protein
MDIHDAELGNSKRRAPLPVPNDRGSIQEINSKINEEPTLQRSLLQTVTV